MKNKTLAISALREASKTCVQERRLHFADRYGQYVCYSNCYGNTTWCNSKKVSAIGVLWRVIEHSVYSFSIVDEVRRYFDFTWEQINHIDCMNGKGRRSFADIAKYIEKRC